MTFLEKLLKAQAEKKSRVCVGFDPDPEKLPAGISATPAGILNFAVSVLDKTAPLACIIKPNQGFWASCGAEEELAKFIRHAQHEHGLLVILDGKRGDIANSAKMYAQEMYVRYGADAATVNAYLGDDTLGPWLKCGPEKAIFVLAHTSNKGAAKFQELKLENGRPVFVEMAGLATGQAAPEAACIGLVMGATFPAQIAELNGVVPANTPLLIPGIGKQEGELLKTLENCRQYPFVINSSGGIIHASREADYADAAAREAMKLRDEINAALEQLAA